MAQDTLLGFPAHTLPYRYRSLPLYRQSHAPGAVRRGISFFHFSLALILALTSGDRSLPAARTGRLGSLKKCLRTSSKGSTA